MLINLSSCKSKGVLPCNEINSRFKGNINIKANDNLYSCEIVKSSPSTIYIKFTSPKELENITYEIKNDCSIVSYNNLKYEKNNNIFYDNSFITSLVDILNFISLNDNELNFIKTKDKSSEYNGVVNNKSFKVFVNCDTGFIDKIEVEQDNFIAEFCNLSNID